MYKFQHVATDRHGDDILEVTVNVPEQHCTATELVGHFTHFLQGCGFIRESVLQAMLAAAKELDLD